MAMSKNWQGVADSTSSSDPKAKPSEGSARPSAQPRWQGCGDSTVSSNPNDKPAGSPKIPGGK